MSVSFGISALLALHKRQTTFSTKEINGRLQTHNGHMIKNTADR